MYRYFPNVDKLVVITRLYDRQMEWQAIGSAFPSTLKRIQLHEETSYRPTDGLFSILKARKDSGSPIQSLQFIRRQDPSHPQYMDAVRQEYEELCANWGGVVDSISYEIVDKLPEMEVPMACATPADVYSVWVAKVWNSNELHKSDRGQFEFEA